jgi:hypothetical protein
MGLKRDLGATGATVLRSDRLNPSGDDITSDISDLLAALSGATVPELLLEHKGLTDEFLKDLDDLDYWLAIQRASYREQLLRKFGAIAGTARRSRSSSREVAPLEAFEGAHWFLLWKRPGRHQAA